jgi:hypothetical protein
VAAYLARFEGTSREHTESDLRCYLAWCTERGLDPLAAQRPHLEFCIRWMQEIRRFRPSTVSRRFSVVAGFYRTCDWPTRYGPRREKAPPPWLPTVPQPLVSTVNQAAELRLCSNPPQRYARVVILAAQKAANRHK